MFTFQDGGKLNAEIRWTLKDIVSRESYNSVTDSVNVFKAVFPGSKIASIIDLGKNKLKYVMKSEIAPHRFSKIAGLLKPL